MITQTRTYKFNLNVHLELIRTGLTEIYKANAAEPYDPAAYDAASDIVKGLVLALTDGDPEMAASIRDDLYDWTGEKVGAWFIVNWIERNDTQIPGFHIDQFRKASA